ncbi:aromatic ring-hydroxylating dioxygenase subunit alpha [Variovorax sp. J31P179]|uniref:aromatic ring-hydroxylating dioxygenase subunit alpha n=1 Tax=Variovorax sp. J31P179 TaxID=3053508 RepID=UPI0025755FDD|nr:aromatic ring-hydroxylating dioxygenase subunit alpha [Variovorax sp. J31P179]MDM0084124.1 aromatic ring-hydroxylating dioxygenase subunit alpha [Variovorax sp. J31P179]
MIEKSLWHPVALADELATAPLAVRLLGDKLVLWRDGAGTVHAWADRCPHRGAQLSLGRVVACERGAVLECPYHGWRFEPGGRCIHVPALPDFVPPATHRAVAHAAVEAQGLVWVRLESDGQGDAALPAFEAEDDAGMRKISCGPYDVETSAPRLVENFLDMAHFGFVHEGWLGAREMAVIDDYRVEATPDGLRATGCKAWQPQSTVNSTAPAQVEYTYEVTAPYAAVLTKVPEASSVGIDGYRESIALQICPVDAERSRVWFRFATSDFERDAASVRAFQDTIFLQDKPVLESQSPKRLPLDLRAELHTVADKASSLYRRHLKMRGITFGVC